MKQSEIEDFVLIPKLQLGNADLEAPASSREAGALVVIHKYSSNRHTRREAGIQARDGNFKYVHVAWIPAVHAGMTGFVTFVYNDESWSLGTRRTLTIFAFLCVLRVFVVNAFVLVPKLELGKQQTRMTRIGGVSGKLGGMPETLVLACPLEKSYSGLLGNLYRD